MWVREHLDCMGVLQWNECYTYTHTYQPPYQLNGLVSINGDVKIRENLKTEIGMYDCTCRIRSTTVQSYNQGAEHQKQRNLIHQNRKTRKQENGKNLPAINLPSTFHHIPANPAINLPSTFQRNQLQVKLTQQKIHPAGKITKFPPLLLVSTHSQQPCSALPTSIFCPPVQ